LQDFESSLSERKQDQKKQEEELNELEYLKAMANHRNQPQYAPSPKSSSAFYDVAILVSAFGAIGFLLYTGLVRLSKDTVKNTKRSSKKTQ
jgi:hypothetical protein